MSASRQPHRHAHDARFFLRGAELAAKECERLAPTQEALQLAGRIREACSVLKSRAAELEECLK